MSGEPMKMLEVVNKYIYIVIIIIITTRSNDNNNNDNIKRDKS